MDKKKEVKAAAQKMASAYKTWVTANAEYNVFPMPDVVEHKYTINWAKKLKP